MTQHACELLQQAEALKYEAFDKRRDARILGWLAGICTASTVVNESIAAKFGPGSREQIFFYGLTVLSASGALIFGLPGILNGLGAAEADAQARSIATEMPASQSHQQQPLVSADISDQVANQFFA